MDREIDLLSRVAANHLLLGQLESFRALLLSLRRRHPALAASILRRVVLDGGRIDGALIRSPSELAWLATAELLTFDDALAGWGMARVDVRLKVEFLLLVEMAWSKELESGNPDARDRLRWILDWGVRRLKGDGGGEGVEEAVSGLEEVVLMNCDVFDAMCWNLHLQHERSERRGPETAAGAHGEGSEKTVDAEDAALRIHKHLQSVHLDAMKKCIDREDLEAAISHTRYLHLDAGLEHSEYRSTLQALIKKVSVGGADLQGSWHAARSNMLLAYANAISSGCIQLVQMIQSVQDELISDDIEQHRVSNGPDVPLPLQKYLDALKSGRATNVDAQLLQKRISKYCMIDMYHHARISGSHILESIVESALYFVKSEHLQEASDVLYLFPLLGPLVAVMGWDLLSGKTELRRKMMHILWTSKSQALRLEEHSFYRKQADEMSCIEYLCDIMCFHLDIASFVACVNSGNVWNAKGSMLFSRKEYTANGQISNQCDPFVENFVLERLAVQTPLRVLFDVVPGIKFQDAIELITMQPIYSTTMAWKRLQDIELLHFRYALESAVISLGTMELCSDDDNNSNLHQKAMWLLKDLRSHVEAIKSIPRRVFLLSILLSLLHMDKLSVDLIQGAPMNYLPSWEQGEVISSVEGHEAEVTFIKTLLDILSSGLPNPSSTLDDMFRSGGITASGKQALEWRVSSIKNFVEDWEWRLSILQQLLPLSGQLWGWKEALAILRAAPSSLLNLCLQKAKYDIGEEAVHRFSLPAEDKAALELSEWVTGAFQRASVEDTVSRAAEGNAGAFQELDFSSLRSQLGSLVAILLCIDVAATSARSLDICMQLLTQARGMLSEIYPGGAPKSSFSYWDQIQEITLISIVRRILQRMLDLLEQEKALTLQEIFSGETFISHPEEPNKHGQRQRALSILHQMIDDAHRGKRQFLSGKLHNLARALAEDEIEANNPTGDRSLSNKKASGFEKEAVLGLAFRSSRPVQAPSVPFESGSGSVAYDVKDNGKRLLAPLGSKSSTYLSSFILYIAMIGDIVDGIDTTHDFNFFSLVYEWPKDLLTRLVFERESSDAAEKVADVMRADFVHEVISACVPPVFPPRSGQGWACIPLISSFPRRYLDSSSQPSKEAKPYPISAFIHELPQYPLHLDIVKHLAKLSPVRAILACVFGSSILSSGSGSSISCSVGELVRAPDTERLFYEFALEQSERFPTLNRWIQMQSNLHKVSESALATSHYSDIDLTKSESKSSLKRYREPESDTESDIDEMAGNIRVSAIKTIVQDHTSSTSWNESPISAIGEHDSVGFLSLDWENEKPYENAVGRLIDEGKLSDALALSDRFLRNGASDRLLQLLIEHEEEGPQPSFGSPSFSSSSWQYCLRLKDKQLAARLAIKYLRRWDLDPAMDVLTMCSFHLSPDDRTRLEVLHRRSALQKYYHILSVDDSYNNWQEVEADCMRDPEGLALRLAGKGAVSAALEVAESAALSVDLRRELQGRQLVKLLTTDPLSGGGPAEASRFLSLLPDPNDALPVAMGAMQQLHDLRSKQLLVNFFLKRRAGTLSDAEFARLNLWALGLRILAILPAPWQQKCSSLHEYPDLILEVLLMTKELQHASTILKEFPSLRDDNLILVYSAKAIAISAPVLKEPRVSVFGSRVRQKPRPNILSKSTFTNSLSNLQREARRAFSWTPRDGGSKDAPKDTHRKRKSSGVVPMQRGSLELMSGIQEEPASSTISGGLERFPSISMCEEWLLTGDTNKDNAVRSSHRYETAPDIVLFKGLLSLCSDELVSAKGALDLCVTQMKKVLSSQQLPLDASMEAISRAYHATEAFVQALFYAKSLLRKFAGTGDLAGNLERCRDADDAASGDTSCSSISSQVQDELSELQAQADFWLGRAELLQSLLGSGIIASLDDIADEESSARLCDRLTQDERYSMAIYTCKKCKIGAFPVWNAWGHALLRMEHYAQARIKFKQALQLYKVDPLPIVLKIVDAIEGDAPVDVSAVWSMFQHLAKSASTIMDDSLSADAYLNVLHMPSTFSRSERSRRSLESVNDLLSISDFDDGPHSSLDSVRYVECIYYLNEYARPQMLSFMFRHGHYADACMLFFPPNGLPSPPQLSVHGAVTTSSSPQRPDSLATDYGTIEELCDFCIGYGAVDVLENLLSQRIDSLTQDSMEAQYNAAALSRICNFCEAHRHFNYLYKFQVIKKDHFAAGLTCIQLFMNSTALEEAIKHLENAKVHFDEALSTRKWGGETTRLVSKAVRGKSASEKLNEDGLVKFSARVSLQVDVIRAFNNIDGPQWKHSLFGNPNDSETFRRRCKIAESLAEKNFDLAFQVIYQFGLPAVDIYAGVASSLAEKKKSNLLMEFFRNIKGTIAAEDWDEVLGAAINTYADKHKERHDRLIDMLLTSHRKVLACVVCGRLKSAFQIASRSGSVADVQYVAHQALQSNAQPILEMCRQWLSQYM